MYVHTTSVLYVDMSYCTDTCGFKSSTQKKDPDLQMLLCNLHIQKIRVQELLPDGKQFIFRLQTHHLNIDLHRHCRRVFILCNYFWLSC